jgi:TolA-binding protein
MNIEVWKIVVGIIGATGFWKLLEFLVRYRSDKKVKSAEARNLNASAQRQIVDGWVQWSQKLKKRVEEFEKHSDAMEKIIEKQRKQIRCLEGKMEKMETENKQLLDELKKLKKNERH